MSKFRKVAETQVMPDYIEKQFVDGSGEEDIYSHLREASKRHKFVVAKESTGTDQYASKQPKEWERIASAALYQQPRMLPENESLSNLTPQDLSTRSVRRAGYDIDDGDNGRPGQFQWGTDQDVTSAMIRGASIFDNDLEEISQSLIEQNEASHSHFISEQEKRRQQEVRHANWEREQQNMLRPRTISSSRANPIIRTGMENISDGAFGMHDYNEIEGREKQRFDMAEAKRKEKLAISRIGKDPDQQQQQWQDDVDLSSNSYQSYQSDWLDNFGS